MALATFYHAFDGQDWPDEYDNWLDYNVNECFWFNADLDRPPLEPVDPAQEAYRDAFEEARKGYQCVSCDGGSASSDDAPKLSVSNYNINGTIPSAIGALVSLTSLDLSSNNINGTIPSDVGALHRLTKLDLSRNEISESIPNEIDSFTALESMDLSRNKFSGTIPGDIGALTSLKRLNLRQNTISGVIPSGIGRTNLTHLLLSNNVLSGFLPAACVLVQVDDKS